MEYAGQTEKIKIHLMSTTNRDKKGETIFEVVMAKNFQVEKGHESTDTQSITYLKQDK